MLCLILCFLFNRNTNCIQSNDNLIISDLTHFYRCYDEIFKKLSIIKMNERSKLIIYYKDKI